MADACIPRCDASFPIDNRLLTVELFCQLVSVLRGDSKVSGTVVFEQDSESSPTTITWDITGQDANAKRGFHIHTFGDNTNGCTSAGPHCKFESQTKSEAPD